MSFPYTCEYEEGTFRAPFSLAGLGLAGFTERGSF